MFLVRWNVLSLNLRNSAKWEMCSELVKVSFSSPMMLAVDSTHVAEPSRILFALFCRASIFYILHSTYE